MMWGHKALLHFKESNVKPHFLPEERSRLRKRPGGWGGETMPLGVRQAVASVCLQEPLTVSRDGHGASWGQRAEGGAFGPGI